MLESVRTASDAWLLCACGREHWGIFGAAGLLLIRLDSHQQLSHVLLQHRAGWVDQGGTWSIPGGALHQDESPEEGALRETREETSIRLNSSDIIGSSRDDHGNWSYTTVVALAHESLKVASEGDEAQALEWVALSDINDLPLHEGFRAGWEALRLKIEARAL